jgi:hypothetical protein
MTLTIEDDSRTAWLPPVHERVIVTGTDRTQEDILPWWYSNVRAWTGAHIALADFGMTVKGRRDAAALGFDVLPTPFLMDACSAKAFAILCARGRSVLWLDTDVQVVSALDGVFDTPTPNGIAAAHDGLSSLDPLFRDNRQVNAGVVLARDGCAAVSKWALETLHGKDLPHGVFTKRYPSDQYVLNRLIESGEVTVDPLSKRYNHYVCPRIPEWYRRNYQVPYDEAVCRHIYAMEGKDTIRRMMRGQSNEKTIEVI